MCTPTLDDLPDPPPDKAGWPWTEQSDPLPETQPDGTPWPKISIVTPSYNQGEFIEETIRSVLLQGYPNLEYVVIDGGSTDDTLKVIGKYSPWVKFWESESDCGQSHAINKGFRHCSGEWGNWVNSDDFLCKDALHQFPLKSLSKNTLYVGDCILVDRQSEPLRRHSGSVKTLEDLVRVPDVWRSGGSIPQISALFSIEMYWDMGGLNVLNHYAMDYELWANMMLSGTNIKYVESEVGYFRVYEEQKVSNVVRTTNAIVECAKKILRESKCIKKSRKKEIKKRLEKYQKKKRVGGGGRLFEWGLPGALIKLLREIRSSMPH
jgi:glycosyltransferase involved in cell wall biosynthesis